MDIIVLITTLFALTLSFLTIIEKVLTIKEKLESDKRKKAKKKLPSTRNRRKPKK